MATRAVRDADELRLTEVVGDAQLVVALALPRLTLVDPRFEAAFRAVESDAVALVGRISRTGVAHLNPVRIADRRRHLVVNVDILRPNAAVSDIAVMLLVVHIEVDEVLVLHDVPIEIAIVPVRAAAALRAAKGVVLAVMLERPLGINELGLRANPPIEQVEVMTRFVHEQRARETLLPVPTAKIGGA